MVMIPFRKPILLAIAAALPNVPASLAAHRDDFVKPDGLILNGVAMVRDYPPVPTKPEVRISWQKPSYYLHDGKPAGYGHFGQLARLPNGHLIAAYQEQGTGAHGAQDTSRRTVCRISKDGGYTWGDATVVGREWGFHWGLCPLKDGAIWLAPVVKRDGKRYIPRSSDEGRTWDTSMASEGFFRFTIQMSNGEILGCTKGRDERGRQGRAVRITDAKGSKWESVFLGAQSGHQTDEWWVTETGKPGVLYALMRDQSQAYYYSQAWSNDYGRTWHGYSPSGVWFSPRPSRPHVTTLPDGTLVAVHAERGHGRIMAVPSFDDGKTWHRDAAIAVLDSPDRWLVGSHGYCDTALTDDGLLMVSWYAGAKAEADPECNGRGFYGSHVDPRYFSRPRKGVTLATIGDPDDSRLIGRWSFEDDAHGVVHDSVNGNYGHARRVGRSAGKIGRGLRLNGRDSMVEVPDTPSMRAPNFFTIECFFRADDPTRAQALISKRPYYYLGLAHGKLTFQLGDPTNQNMPTVRLDSGGDVTAEKWHHAAAVVGIDRAGYKYAYLYLEGKEVAKVRPYSAGLHPDSFKAGTGAYYVDMRPDTGPLFHAYGKFIGYHVPPAENLCLGCDNVTRSGFLSGDLDEVSLYGRRLFPDEIEALTTRGYPVDAAGTATSAPINREGPGWGTFQAKADVPGKTAIAFAVLDETGSKVLKPGLKPGDSLADVSALAIRLQAKLTTKDRATSPVLRQWALTGTVDE